MTKTVQEENGFRIITNNSVLTYVRSVAVLVLTMYCSSILQLSSLGTNHVVMRLSAVVGSLCKE
jgi:hypothetical protein